jgi:hypothetical protein
MGVSQYGRGNLRMARYSGPVVKKDRLPLFKNVALTVTKIFYLNIGKVENVLGANTNHKQ